MRRQIKSTVVSFFKLGFAAGLIYWLIHSGKITLEPFIQLTQNFWLIPLVLVSTLISILTNNYRWLLLLRGQKIEIGHRETLKLSFIGLFFNLAMPGSVGGDVLKGYYITRRHPKDKMRVATSVLVDRIVGFYSIILIAFFATVYEWKIVTSNPALKAIGFFVVAMAIGFSAFFVVGFSRRIRGHGLWDSLLAKIPGGKTIEKIYDAVHSYRAGEKQFITGVILSLLAQSQLILGLYIVAQTLGYNPGFEAFFFVIPVGLMATAIPISPAGLGVGQVVFLKLFHWYTGVESTIGPTLITINQVCFAIFGLVGAGVYFLYKSHHE